LPVHIDVSQVPFDDIQSLRDLYRQEMNCQIVHDSLPARGFCNLYLIRVDGRVAGYGCVLGFGDDPKDVIREFYVLPVYRSRALLLFRRLIAASHASKVEAQTNDVLLTLMLFDCTREIESDTVLFHDAFTTRLAVPSLIFRKITEADRAQLPPEHPEGIGNWMLEDNGTIAASGGILCHYNPPYGDIFMNVDERFRRRGYGSYLVQELKRLAYELGRIPAARCGIHNVASRATLQKAGFLPCARIIKGTITATE
jgi:GNAT superfamily N-acetyltransferase